MPDYSQMTPEQVEALRKGLATPRLPQGQGLPEFNQQAGAALEAMQAAGVGGASAAPNPYANAGAYQAAQAAGAPPANVPFMPPASAGAAVGAGIGAAPATVPNPYPSLPLPQRMAAPIPQGMPFAGNTLASLYGKANETRDFSDIKSIFDRMAEAKGSPVQSPGQPPPMPAVPQQQPEHGYEAPPVWMPAPGWGLDMADPELKRMATNLAMNGHGEAAAHLMGIGKEDQSAMAGHQAAIQGAMLGAHAHGYGADVAARGEAAKNALSLMTHRETQEGENKRAGEHNKTLMDIASENRKAESDKFKTGKRLSDEEKADAAAERAMDEQRRIDTNKRADNPNYPVSTPDQLARIGRVARERHIALRDKKDGSAPTGNAAATTVPPDASRGGGEKNTVDPAPISDDEAITDAQEDLKNSIKNGKLNPTELLARAKSSIAKHGPVYNKALLGEMLNHQLGNEKIMAPFLGQMAGDLVRGQDSMNEHKGYKFKFTGSPATFSGLPNAHFTTPYGFDVEPEGLPRIKGVPKWLGGGPDAEAMERFSIAEALLGAMRKPK